MDKFKRGYVAWGTIPEVIHTTETPRPGFFVTGKHLYISIKKIIPSWRMIRM